jgi:2-polyprenyl-3-methyl-5-hydroxy-6-metoxy-1,4-benzoquinol methylase
MHTLFMPIVFALSGELKPGTPVLDVGCGNGSTCGEFLKHGSCVSAIGREQLEPPLGVGLPGHVDSLLAQVQTDVLQNLNKTPFALLISTEGVEHLYDPTAMRGAVSPRSNRATGSSAPATTMGSLRT